MVGRTELGFPTGNSPSIFNAVKHKRVMTKLRQVRSEGHIYVEAREDGKKLVFFCTLCHSQCHGETNLSDHLKGRLHEQRLKTARLTLLKPNPWPFSDGVFFFKADPQEETETLSDSDSKLVELTDTQHMHESSLAMVTYQGSGATHYSREIEGNGDKDNSNADGQGNANQLVIPGVLQKDVVSELVVTRMGFGVIGAKFIEKDGVPDQIHRIWCEWLGNENSNSEGGVLAEKHDFAVITFSYDCNLGRMSLLQSFKFLLPASPHSEADDSVSSRSKKRKSLSDPGNSSNQYTSPGPESEPTESDDQLLRRILASKPMRQELRGRQIAESKRLCNICRLKMLPQQDVAALLNIKTGKLVCSSRNLTGAFHVFHISCLLRWILICEVESYINQPVKSKPKRRSKRKTIRKTAVTEENREIQARKKQIDSVLCSECQGTGILIPDDTQELEIPCIPSKEIHRCKMDLCDAHKAWMESPEMLERCSMGFTFPLQSDETPEEYIQYRKLLQFYRANG